MKKRTKIILWVIGIIAMIILPDANSFSYHIYQPKNGSYLLLNDIGNTMYYIIRLKAMVK